MEFNVRPATQADSAGVVETVRAVYDEFGFSWEEEGYHADLYNLGQYYLSHGHSFAVAEGKSGIVGTVALEIFPILPGAVGEVVTHQGKLRIAGCDCALNRLYVHPAARRQGIAWALCEFVLNSAKTRNCRSIEIWSDKRFTAAHSLYERLGARVVSERICDDPDLSPEWGLILPLSGK